MVDEGSSSKRAGKNLTWLPYHDNVLLDVLQMQISKGGRVNGKWTNQAWREISREVADKLGEKYTGDKIRNRMKSLKVHYQHMHTLRHQKGWGWDEERKMIIVDSNQWKQFTDKYPEYGKYRGVPFDGYDTLAVIFGESMTSLTTTTALNEDEDIENSLDLTKDSSNLPSCRELSLVVGSLGSKLGEKPSNNDKKKRKASSLPSEITESQIETQMDNIIDIVMDMMHSKVSLQMKCMEIVNEMELDDDEYFEISMLLMQENVAKMFLAIKPERRLMWLKRQLD